MTLWQEQSQQERQGTGSNSGAPRSRREARDAERRAGETGDLSNLHPSGVYDMSATGDIWDTLSRRAASQLADTADEAERRTGRRTTDGASPVEPLSYTTQGRPQIPTYDSARRAAAPLPPLPPAPQAPDSSFSPEDTRTRPVSRIMSNAFPAVSTPVAMAAPVPQVAPIAPAPASSAPIEHTLSRRELRAIRETGAIQPLGATSTEDAGAWLPGWVPEESVKAAPQPSAPASQLAGSAFAAFNDTSTVEMSAIDRASMEADEPVMLLPEPVTERPATAPARRPFEVTTPRTAAEAPDARTAVPAPAEQAAPKSSAGLQGFEALIAQASAGLASAAPEVDEQAVRIERPFTPPKGHWSVQAQADDEHLPFQGKLSRNVGSTSAGANSLIMPKDPSKDLFTAVNSTGEILITGSLDLPRSLASTGANSDHYDSSEIDRLFEASQDDQHNTSDVAPVRAARAVATHTSTRSMVNPRKRRGGMLPTVLAITAAVMAVGVAALLFAGYVLRIF
jgi:hypothetical protein